MIRTALLLSITAICMASCAEVASTPRAVGDDESGESSAVVEIDEDEVVSGTLNYRETLQLLDSEPELSETHADAASVRVWGTAEAAELFYAIDPDDPSLAVEFSEGTTFVKEHFDEQGEMFGVNIMFKGPSGYSPDFGDWVWIRVRGEEVTHVGEIEACQECHSAAINSDFVVGFGKSQ